MTRIDAPRPATLRTCVRCVMDESATETTFDADGVCSWCHLFDARREADTPSESQRDATFQRIVTEIRESGRGAKYDCLIGLSGGADSSYAALLAVRAGLRPLALHVDNGWNTEAAVHNIERIVRGLKLDLVTEVIDWEEFRGLQLSLLRAGVVDLELVSDHAIIAGVFRTARRHGIKYVVTGDNHATEATLPRGWNHRKTDLRNIKAINRAFADVPIETFPTLSTLEMLFHRRVLGIRHVGILTYVDYVKERAMDDLEASIGWRRYGKKHSESIITRFYQGYILPKKFGIDKRRFHYSLLIHSGQMTREEAIDDLARPTYDPKQQEADKIYTCKKFGISTEEFDRIMAEPPRSHHAYPSEEKMLQVIFKAARLARRARGVVLRT